MARDGARNRTFTYISRKTRRPNVQFGDPGNEGTQQYFTERDSVFVFVFFRKCEASCLRQQISKGN